MNWKRMLWGLAVATVAFIGILVLAYPLVERTPAQRVADACDQQFPNDVQASRDCQIDVMTMKLEADRRDRLDAAYREVN